MSLRSRSADVVIVGGGIIGTSAAAFLAEAGLSVVLVEQTAVASGASGRNSGAVQDPFDPILTELHARTIEIYRRLTDADLGFALPASPAGLLLVGVDEAPIHDICRGVRDTRPDLDPTVLSGPDLRLLEPELANDLVGCRLNTGYPVPPAAATVAFARRAAAAGAELRIGATASLWRSSGWVEGVEADGERLSAGAVLVAAGAATAELIDPTGAWRPIRPIWGVNVDLQLSRPPRAVIEEAAVEEVATAGTEGPAEHREDDIPSIFSLVTAKGSSSLGSTFLPWRPDVKQAAPLLRDRGSLYVPSITDSPIRSVRVCARPQSIDGRPLLGQVPGIERLFVASGHGPWGISLGPASSQLVGDLIRGLPVAIPTEVSADRFGDLP